MPWFFEVEQLAAREIQLRLDVEIDAVRPSTELGIVEEVIEHLPEGQRDHDEVDARSTQHEQTDQKRQSGGNDQRRRKRQPKTRRLVLRGEKRNRISCHAEKRGVSEADQAGITDEKTQGDRAR